ncbi:MAG TPA: hypothetical protein VFX80_05870, partial [Solirubrobacteraceae bacterium]|nr:hypothetical protein [Solirubrobacteraceae bacterium]
MRRVVVAAVALLVALQAPAARADVTFGPDLTVAPTAALGVGGSLTAAADMATAPFAGVITRWRVRVGPTSGAVRLVVIRRPQGTGANPGFVVARSKEINPPTDAVT